MYLKIYWISLLQQFFLVEKAGNAKLKLAQDGAVLRLGNDQTTVVRLVGVDRPQGPHHLPIENILLAGCLWDGTSRRRQT